MAAHESPPASEAPLTPTARVMPQPTGSFAPAAGAPSWCAGLVGTGLSFVSRDARDLATQTDADLARMELGATSARLRSLAASNPDSPSPHLIQVAEAIEAFIQPELTLPNAAADLVASITKLGEVAQSECGFSS